MSLNLSNSALGLLMEQEPERLRQPRQRRSAIYLFTCHLEWVNRRRLDAYQELVAALDDWDKEVRMVAETLLRRSSPHREGKAAARPAPQKNSGRQTR